MSTPIIQTHPNAFSLDPACESSKRVANVIRWYSPDFSPKDVPRFCDLASICENPEVFRLVIDIFVERYKAAGKEGPTHIAGYESRGFILAAPIAYALGIPCIMLRKCGKVPGVLSVSSEFHKEYSESQAETMSLRVGSIKKGDRVVLVDDLIATGGTAVTGFELVYGLGAEVFEFAAITELPSLHGVKNIHCADGGKYKDISVFTMLSFESITEKSCADPVGWPQGKSRVVPLGEAEEVRAQYNLC
eukprot:PhM_4_TR7148/c0_g1_i1/m.39058/K00759/APRT, apt; adenine phosphoribosyltransferase